jgi:hypothetical protein
VFVPATSLSKDGEVGGALCGMVLKQKVGVRTLARCRLKSKLFFMKGAVSDLTKRIVH